ncbi:glycosyltransferase family 4 protein [Kaistia terrae]|uniref:Glycosyltransferase family 4 protein n=1 Tax=Kaistia terrae TaxID=537017 RepID=A0ABW0Q183_9HYPH|nr:glycosyltransferase family 4 protein [Kaistia terrae]MCX5578609.1 glycosyltransferase family 4 protein [Kaistia terrae]
MMRLVEAASVERSDPPRAVVPLRISVVQDGSRLHYGLPLGLKLAGILGTVHTDWFVRPGSLEAMAVDWFARMGGATGRRLADRRCAGLDDSRVVASGWVGLLARFLEGRGETPEAIFVRRSQAIASQVMADGWRDANGLAGFVRNIDPALCEAARCQGLAVVLDQMIAPIDVQVHEEARQAELWPNWQSSRDRGADIMRRIERQSWDAASHITCASDYVRDGLIGTGVARERISVIPYPVDVGAFPFSDRRDRKGPVVVGFVGAISLRKGAPAFFEIAKRFDPAKVRFVMVGPITAAPALVERHRGAVEVIGSVPRTQVRQWLERFDLFLFPSVCEGSAGAVMEAMSTGLPVVTTPNSGTPVRDGEEGYVLGCEDLAGMARRVDQLVRDQDLRLRMGAAAHDQVQALTVLRYGQAWHDLLRRVCAHGGQDISPFL